MGTPQLPAEVEATLVRYLAIQEEERRLDEEKATLRDRLARHLQDYQDPFWFPTVAGQALKVRVRHDTEVRYNEEILRERLGDSYRLILRPDPAKIRRNLARVESLLQPALDLVGSPDREQVRLAVEKGTVPREAFAGAFEKRNRTSITVTRLRADEGRPF